jgi:hypothetical protein
VRPGPRRAVRRGDARPARTRSRASGCRTRSSRPAPPSARQGIQEVDGSIPFSSTTTVAVLARIWLGHRRSARRDSLDRAPDPSRAPAAARNTRLSMPRFPSR